MTNCCCLNLQTLFTDTFIPYPCCCQPAGSLCVGVISVRVFPSAWTLIKSRACSQCRLCECRKSHTAAISHPRTSSNLIALLAQRSLSEQACVCMCVLIVTIFMLYRVCVWEDFFFSGSGQYVSVMDGGRKRCRDGTDASVRYTSLTQNRTQHVA